MFRGSAKLDVQASVSAVTVKVRRGLCLPHLHLALCTIGVVWHKQHKKAITVNCTCVDISPYNAADGVFTGVTSLKLLTFGIFMAPKLIQAKLLVLM